MSSGGGRRGIFPPEWWIGTVLLVCAFVLGMLDSHPPHVSPAERRAIGTASWLCLAGVFVDLIYVAVRHWRRRR